MPERATCSRTFRVVKSICPRREKYTPGQWWRPLRKWRGEEQSKGRHGSFRAHSSFVHLTQMSRRLDIFFVSAVGQYPSPWLHNAGFLIGVRVSLHPHRIARCNHGGLRIPAATSSAKRAALQRVNLFCASCHGGRISDGAAILESTVFRQKQSRSAETRMQLLKA